MTPNESTLAEQIEAVESVDLLTEDLVEALASALRSSPDFAHKVLTLTGEGRYVMVEVARREDVRDNTGVVLPAMSFIDRDGQIKNRVRRTFMIGDEAATLDAEINLV